MKFGNQIKIIRDYYPILLLIPTLTGGVNQIYSLYKINPYYVRFLSVSQLISDGCWLLLLLIPVYFVYLFLFYHKLNWGTIEFFNRYLMMSEVDIRKLNFKNVVKANFGVIGFFAFYLPWGFLTRMHYTLPLMNGLMAIFVSMFTFRSNLGLLRYFPKFNYSYLFIFTSAIIFIVGNILVFKLIFSNNDMPKDIANMSNLNSLIPDEFEYHTKKMIYWNDNYSFVKMYCDSINEPSSKVYIIKTESLFEPNN